MTVGTAEKKGTVTKFVDSWLYNDAFQLYSILYTWLAMQKLRYVPGYLVFLPGMVRIGPSI